MNALCSRDPQFPLQEPDGNRLLLDTSKLPNSSLAMSSAATRHRVLALYKELHRLGRDYPDPSCANRFLCMLVSRPLKCGGCADTTFTGECGGCSRVSPCVYTVKLLIIENLCTENKGLSDPEEIEKAIGLGEYIKNGTSSCALAYADIQLAIPHTETLALYSLKKYRHLKQRYPEPSNSEDSQL